MKRGGPGKTNSYGEKEEQEELTLMERGGQKELTLMERGNKEELKLWGERDQEHLKLKEKVGSGRTNTY